MFTRSLFHTADMGAQHELLNETAHLIETGATLRAIGAANLRRAHPLIESRRARDKIVLEGF